MPPGQAHLPLDQRAEKGREVLQGSSYLGVRSAGGGLVGVSIMRAGETMEQALREVVKDAKMGKILIQTNEATQEPELHFKRLPPEITQYRVLLMDATVATGAAAIMAIRVLIEHDVPEANICLLALLMAHTGSLPLPPVLPPSSTASLLIFASSPAGVQSVAYAFPRVRIITTAVDWELNADFHVIPGIGNFGDRFYGPFPHPLASPAGARGGCRDGRGSGGRRGGRGGGGDVRLGHRIATLSLPQPTTTAKSPLLSPSHSPLPVP